MHISRNYKTKKYIKHIPSPDVIKSINKNMRKIKFSYFDEEKKEEIINGDCIIIILGLLVLIRIIL